MSGRECFMCKSKDRLIYLLKREKYICVDCYEWKYKKGVFSK